MEEKKHNVIIENKAKIIVTSCEEIISCNENEAMMVVSDNVLTVRGKGIRVEEMSKLNSEATIIGESIESVVYSKSRKGNKEGLIGRIFK